MSDLTVALTESLIGMAVTLALLGALAMIFQLIGKYELMAKRKGAAPSLVIPSQAGSDDDLPYIAAAAYLYMKASSKKRRKGDETT
ncbi:MAG: hypothetical protein NO516_02800 [Candidatus Methanomethylicia archaeon]|nr:hypothetical protein [Candidatus Methanomethylicia archaeon]